MLIQANGIEMNYEISGKKNAPLVILSHSLGSSLKMWNPQMEALESHFRVLRYDIRGHGRSSTPPAPYTMELLGEDAVGLLNALKVDQVHWVGLSMGGMIGQSIALNHPHRLRSLSLCDTGAIVPAEAQPIWQERIESVRQKGMESQLQGTMERWFTPPFLSLNPPMLALIKKEFLTTPAEGYIHCCEAIRRLNTLERLRGINLPTLIIVGEDDPGMPVSASEAMHQRIPQSKLVVLKSARHLSNVEQPEAFNTHLIDFLKKY
jgi:3-oxoadipate enol-lactonase